MDEAAWKTVQILTRWLHKKPADLDLHCFLKMMYQDSVGQGSACLWHVYLILSKSVLSQNHIFVCELFCLVHIFHRLILHMSCLNINHLAVTFQFFHIFLNNSSIFLTFYLL